MQKKVIFRYAGNSKVVATTDDGHVLMYDGIRLTIDGGEEQKFFPNGLSDMLNSSDKYKQNQLCNELTSKFGISIIAKMHNAVDMCNRLNVRRVLVALLQQACFQNGTVQTVKDVKAVLKEFEALGDCGGNGINDEDNDIDLTGYAALCNEDDAFAMDAEHEAVDKIQGYLLKDDMVREVVVGDQMWPAKNVT
jgi:hypothetical protein